MRPRPEVEKLVQDNHGGIVEAELAQLGIDPEDVADFSTSTNPFGPPESVLQAIQRAHIERYPDRSMYRLRSAISEAEGVLPEEVLPTNGVAQLIWLIALAFLRPSDTVAIIGPTFGEYEVASRLMGAKVERYMAPAEGGFEPNLQQITAFLVELKPKVIWLCNPNNPTGSYLSPEELRLLYDSVPDSLLVLDEAYLRFLRDAESPVGWQRLIKMRSLTKDYAIPGLRLGYALAPRDIIELLAKVQPPWSVNVLAQEAGIAAIRDNEFLEQTMEALQQETERLKERLAGQGWCMPHSPMHYFLVEAEDAAEMRQKLLMEHRILVRDCTSFGLPKHIRISTTLPRENERLATAMAALVELGNG